MRRVSTYASLRAPTLIPSDRHTVWGVNATATHGELARLYTAHAQGLLGRSYLPEAILTFTADGRLRPAMTYICADMDPRPADKAYVEQISGPARQFGFPDWYVEHIESFFP